MPCPNNPVLGAEVMRIRVVWPRHWLNGRVLMVDRSRFATARRRPLSHHGACFTLETRFGRIAIPAGCAREINK